MEIRFVGVKKEQRHILEGLPCGSDVRAHGSEADLEQDQRAVHLAWNTNLDQDTPI